MGQRSTIDMGGFRGVACGLVVLLLWLPAFAHAELALEQPGRSSVLPQPFGEHWIWASDAVLRRSALIDLESERMLGVIDGGWGLTTLLFPRTRNEIYVPETHYSRGSRGTRTDVVTIYDSVSLAPLAEIRVPPKRAHNPLPVGNSALSDDDRFLALFNFTPATSLSIIDMVSRRFVEEILAPGCSLVYAAGPRFFFMLCADGSLLEVRLGQSGRMIRRTRTAPFFDPQKDPVTEKAVRWGDLWIFVSFNGEVYGIDVSGEEPRFESPWSLLDEEDRANSWRIGGSQHLAVHQRSGRLYSLVHQGGIDTHKQGGRELWVYDLATRERIQRIRLHNPGFTYLGVPLEFGNDWVWPFNRMNGWLLDHVLPGLGLDEVQVTQDDHPLLVVASRYSGMLTLYDGLSGEFRGRVAAGNMTTLILQPSVASGTGNP